MGRAPVRATAIREPAAEAPKHGKTRLRKNSSQRSMLDMDNSLIAKLRETYGVDVQWVADQVLGKDEPQMRQDFEINAWEPASQDMFDGAFDGMYMRKGAKGEIRYNGLVLMWRPYELTLEAQAEDEAARIAAMKAQENMVKGGVIPGLSSGFESNHPTAIGKNVFNRTVHAPQEIPRD